MRNVQLCSLVLLACAPLALAGCVDVFFEDVEPEPPVGAAEARFTRDVHPILAARCGSCHADPGIGATELRFVGETPADSYDRVLASPGLVGSFTRSAPILSLPSISHKGVIYTPAERDAIAAWLDAELADRGPPPPEPPPSIETLLQTWSGCLDYGDFLAASMPAAWNALVAGSGSTCATCHASDAGGFTVSSDPMEFFRRISTRRASLLTFFRPDPDRVVMLPNDPLFLAVGARIAPHNLHPAFAYSDGARTALKAFADKTAARLRATPPACSPPRLED